MEQIRESVKSDILYVLDRIIEILEEREEKDVYEIKELSNHTMHSASIFQDSFSISIAVLVYSVFKIIERNIIDDKNYKKILEELKYARLYLRKNKIYEYKKSMDKLFKIVSAVDKRFKVFIQHVIDKAKVNKGSRIYEHGISMARAAELMGLSQWELMSYVGKTAMEDIGRPEKKTLTAKRLAIAMKVFNL